ncbi:carbohydrate-binding family 9-like protein [uncultured Bacteroides sp.]|uniref:carbohydrate-binding family 9-like protein n=1 Tax=uncultured Bacteroides sp. TaxID=162156 RepID=UPI002620F22A|nr:carbohydrate-binding family 9-like protein [uncultured Bacteroides sp.]
MHLRKLLVLMAAVCLILPLSAINPQNNKMKELSVKKVSAENVSAESVPALLDKENVAFQPVNTVNWADFPYAPDVQFRMAHTSDAILLHYKVKEASVRAVAGHDNGPVWKDACVEFFSVPAGDDVYYNMECNCAGVLLIGGGAKGDRRHAPQEVLDKVRRWASLGREPFEERVGACSWEVALVIPCSAFFLHDITSLDGKQVRANFYKCGDDLQTPHFLSWNPIELPKPNFHCPEFFGMLRFE